MTLKDSPCLNCENREVGCHGKCKPYQEFRVRWEAKRKEENTHWYIEGQADRIKKSAISRFKKRRNDGR